jgi:CBS-domain-containing membrane protein
MAKHKTVQDVMTRGPITLPPSASLLDAAKTMRDMGIGDVVVADGDEVIGIVTDRDIVVRGLAAGRDPHTTPLMDISSRELTTVSPDEPIGNAVRLMREHAIRPVWASAREPARPSAMIASCSARAPRLRCATPHGSKLAPLSVVGRRPAEKGRHPREQAPDVAGVKRQ